MLPSDRIQSVQSFREDVAPSRALVVIPTYNERDNMAPLFEAIAAVQPAFDVLIVDDGSPDGTGDIVASLAATFPRRLFLMRRAGKSGLGTAYTDGFFWALAHTDYDVFVEMDADFSHEPTAVPALVERALATGVCVGSRYVPGGSIPDWTFSRRALSRFANIYAGIVLRFFSPRYRVHDSTAGFVAWRRDVLTRLLSHDIPGEGYGAQVSLKYIAHQMGFSPAEYPIVFRDRRVGQSKISRNILGEAIVLIWKLGWKFKHVGTSTSSRSS